MLVILSVVFAAFGGEVTSRETEIVLPTYSPDGYDKTPVFYTGRVYQGAQGRVYPYPMQDVLYDEKHDETYTYRTLENDWLQMGLLPEHGGHLLNFTDKQTGFETFYRVLALRERGAPDAQKEIDANLAELKKGIATLEKPQPKVIDAYAKFGGENSPMERQADNLWKAKYLHGLLATAEGRDDEAQALFKEVAAKKPALLWAKKFAK